MRPPRVQWLYQASLFLMITTQQPLPGYEKTLCIQMLMCSFWNSFIGGDSIFQKVLLSARYCYRLSVAG